MKAVCSSASGSNPSSISERRALPGASGSDGAARGAAEFGAPAHSGSPASYRLGHAATPPNLAARARSRSCAAGRRRRCTAAACAPSTRLMSIWPNGDGDGGLPVERLATRPRRARRRAAVAAARAARAPRVLEPWRRRPTPWHPACSVWAVALGPERPRRRTRPAAIACCSTACAAAAARPRQRRHAGRPARGRLAPRRPRVDLLHRREVDLVVVDGVEGARQRGETSCNMLVVVGEALLEQVCDGRVVDLPAAVAEDDGPLDHRLLRHGVWQAELRRCSLRRRRRARSACAGRSGFRHNLARRAGRSRRRPRGHLASARSASPRSLGAPAAQFKHLRDAQNPLRRQHQGGPDARRGQPVLSVIEPVGPEGGHSFRRGRGRRRDTPGAFFPLDTHIGWIERHPTNGLIYAAGGGRLLARRRTARCNCSPRPRRSATRATSPPPTASGRSRRRTAAARSVSSRSWLTASSAPPPTRKCTAPTGSRNRSPTARRAATRTRSSSTRRGSGR